MKLRFEKVAAEERPPSHPLPARLLPLRVWRLSYLIIWQGAPRHGRYSGSGACGEASRARGAEEAQRRVLLEAIHHGHPQPRLVSDTFNRVWQVLLKVHRSWLRPCPR